MAKGNHDDAVADYSKVAELALKDGNVSGALLAVNQILQIFADSAAPLEKRAHIYVTRANIYETQGRKEEAISDFRRALLFDPNNQDAKVALRRLEASTGVPALSPTAVKAGAILPH